MGVMCWCYWNILDFSLFWNFQPASEHPIQLDLDSPVAVLTPPQRSNRWPSSNALTVVGRYPTPPRSVSTAVDQCKILACPSRNCNQQTVPPNLDVVNAAETPSRNTV